MVAIFLKIQAQDQEHPHQVISLVYQFLVVQGTQMRVDS